MPIFKLISVGTGLLLTTVAIYKAQDKIAEECEKDEDLKSIKTESRVLAGFITSIVIGGGINKVINRTFN
ncbi:hypothetical protein A9G41_10340 [Gilliamella sp. Nev5-1]|uniref:hypothetical protein n=1 Tax=unclassified Gilliamella TaxID=2685620 RepID=UPI00080DEA31|nr:hypothetical protein [Gilliamella apicola]OCG58809.1 hypothetical protein A9G40_08395 [Gilliamella apicola]OCG67464.1 hypothetical protein A9G41_10340 [Gilliamella apicola]